MWGQATAERREKKTRTLGLVNVAVFRGKTEGRSGVGRKTNYINLERNFKGETEMKIKNATPTGLSTRKRDFMERWVNERSHT